MSLTELQTDAPTNATDSSGAESVGSLNGTETLHQIADTFPLIQYMMYSSSSLGFLPSGRFKCPSNYGAWWLIGRFTAFCPKGREFESPSTHNLWTLGRYFIRSCLWRFGVKLQHSIRAE